MQKLKGERKHGTLKQGDNFSVPATWHAKREVEWLKIGWKCALRLHKKV